ncbi:MAG: hypothetical protein ACE5HV_11020, partial [Acidobacteriota bacterium]
MRSLHAVRKRSAAAAWILTAAALLLLGSGGLVPGVQAAQQLQAVDREELGQQAVKLLQTYLRIDTSNPPGNEIRAARFLGGLLQEAGIEHEIFESAPNRGNLYARLRGDGSRGGAVVLLQHMDVVPAD